jgi:hypothetical protein
VVRVAQFYLKVHPLFCVLRVAQFYFKVSPLFLVWFVLLSSI